MSLPERSPHWDPNSPIMNVPPMVSMERLRSAIKFDVPSGVHNLEITDISHLAKDRLDGALFELSAYVLGRRRTPIMHTMTMVIKEERFTSWWQHTKAVHFPTISRWIRRPPRTRFIEHRQTETQEVGVYETFPEAAVGPLPEGFGPVVFQAWDSGERITDSESITG